MKTYDAVPQPTPTNGSVEAEAEPAESVPLNAAPQDDPLPIERAVEGHQAQHAPAGATPDATFGRKVNQCPFCSATWQSGSLGLSYERRPVHGWHVSCMQCKAVGPYVEGGHMDSISLAIDLWNKAASLKEPR